MPRRSALTSLVAAIGGRVLMISALLLTAQAHAQGPAPDKLLLGAWRAAGLVIEFHADGRYEARIAGNNESMQGNWQVVDGKFLLTWSDTARPKRISEFSVRGDYLMVVQSGGRVIVHQRVVAPPSKPTN